MIHPANQPSGPFDPMSNLSKILSQLIAQTGTLAAGVIDGNTGQVLGKTGNADGLELAASINTGVLRAKLHGVKHLAIREVIEDILITTENHYHIVTFVPAQTGLFIYSVIDRELGNLGAVRYAANQAQRELQL